ncbi:MAG: DUF3955 domain-containing protein [Devosiaceae bacterium]|nr:DUF3955 domain-containing protein [Devosiaceae bacterium]
MAKSNKTLFTFIIIGILGIFSAVLFNLLGSTVDSEGFLQEPFYLVPLAYILVLIGFGGALIIIARRYFTSKVK